MAPLVFISVICLVLGHSHGFLLDTLTNHIPHTVCYGDLGCFNNGAPFLNLLHRPLSVDPESPAKIGTRFLLYTRANPTVSREQLLVPTDASPATNTNFNASNPTKIIVHGFTHNGHRMWIQNTTRELLINGDYNVIVTDWHLGAALPYEQATANTRVVGAQIAQLINALIQSTETSAGQFHIIGHSLGAHVAGYAGERVSHLGRITGLDPASPYFEQMDVVVRLDPADADFVDVIHTDGGGVKNLGFGASQTMGNVDFYPNGGSQQPGCATDAVDKLGATSWTAITSLFNYYAEEETLACSHERSYFYFMESINSPCPFKAWKCSSQDEFHQGHCLHCTESSCARMGFYADQSSARGALYLETEATPSYCEYNYQLNISSTNNFDGILTMTLQGTKGTIGPTPLTTKNEVHIGNELMSEVFRSRVDIGDPLHLTLKYDKIAVPIISGSYPDDWHMLGMSMWRAEAEQRDRFCAYHREVDNHNSTTFDVRGATC